MAYHELTEGKQCVGRGLARCQESGICINPLPLLYISAEEAEPVIKPLPFAICCI